MVFLGIGVVLLLMKCFEVAPVGHWSWWIVLVPFAFALVWFEIIEPYFGLDKKKAHDDIEKVREARVRKQLERRPAPRR